MDQRTAHRLPAEFGARCASLGHSADARLLNISLHGCLVEVAEPILAQGNPVRLRIPGLSSLDGKVVWSDGDRAGVVFAAALHPAVVEYVSGCLSSETAERLGVAPATMAG
jgi:hypothetical protein